MPVTERACNTCNDAQVIKAGYCCDSIDCSKTCTRFGDPDLCNFAREPIDAHKMDDCETLPLKWDPSAYKQKLDNPEKWTKEPRSIKNAEQYGTFKPAIFHSELMHKKLEKKKKNG